MRFEIGRLAASIALVVVAGPAMVFGEAISFSVVPNSTLSLNFALPELMRSTSVTRNVAGTLGENLTFGVQSGFGTIATAGQLQGGTLSLGNAQNVVVDLEALGQVTFTGINLRLTGAGGTNPFTAPPLAQGKTRIPLTGASLVLNSGTMTVAGTGFIAGSLGTTNFNFATTPLTLPFPTGAFMDVTVSGSTVTESIPLNLAANFQSTPLAFGFGLTGTLNLTGTTTYVPPAGMLPIAVASLANQRIVGIDSAQQATVLADTGDGLFSPFDVAYDASNNLYVADVLRSRITKFNAAGVGTTFADSADGVVTPSGLAFDSAGNLFATNYLTNTVVKVTPAGVGSLFADAADGLNSPFGLAVDSAGNVYTANLGARQVVKITPAGVASVFADSGDGLFAPFDVAVDTSGNVFVADVLTSRVYKFTPAGVGSIFATSAAGLTTASGLAFDSTGRLLVTNYLSNTVVALNSAGVGTPFAGAAQGLSSPFGIASRRATPGGAGFAAVPEPSCGGLAAMAVLFGAWQVRRRRLAHG